MKLTLTINMNNAAFEDDNASKEATRILRVAAEQIQHGYEVGSLRDINGNHVGRFDIESEDE